MIVRSQLHIDKQMKAICIQLEHFSFECRELRFVLGDFGGVIPSFWMILKGRVQGNSNCFCTFDQVVEEEN